MRNGEKGVMKIMSSSSIYLVYISWGLPKWLSGKESTCNAGDMGLIPVQHDPLEKEMATHSSTLSCLENSMDGEAWWATVHGIAKSRTRLCD